MRIQISEIKVNPGRREALTERVAELAKSIAEVGLLNPVTIDRGNTLIAYLLLLGVDSIVMAFSRMGN